MAFRKKNDKRKPSRPLFKRRKFCRFTAEKIEWVDYKNTDILKDFISENRFFKANDYQYVPQLLSFL